MKVTKDRIYEQDLFEPLKKMARESVAELEKMSAKTKVLSKNLADLAKKYDGTAKSQRLLNEAERESRKIMQDAITLEEKKIKLKTANEKLAQAELRTKKMMEDAEKRELKNKKDLNSEYAKQSKRLNDLRKEYKDLILTQGKETEQTRALKKEILALDSTLKKVDATVGQHQRSVGNYERALGGVRNVLSQLGIGFGVFQILRDSFSIITENEDAMASLSAITGLTGEKFEVFKTAINQTADELNVSSTEVAQAAEKIASAQPKLLENADALAAVTKEAITLNRAIKGDLTETSLALVGVMNQFGLEATEAAEVINILAAGSQAGAASVNQINESIVKFGTTADLMNITVEESVGLIETLGEKAIFGADAGTALRNILLKMSSIDVLPEKALKQLEKYGVDTNIVKDTTLSFEERLRELYKVAKDSTAIMQIFGTENATAATVLLNNLDTYSKMTDAVTDTNVATEQAAINQATLSSVIEELRAAWENLVVKWTQGTNVLGGLKSILKFVADNLESIVTITLGALKAWALQRVATKLLTIEYDKNGKAMAIGLIPNLIKTAKGLLASASAFKAGAISAKSFGKALSGIPIVAIISGLYTLVSLFWDTEEAVDATADGMGDLTQEATGMNRVNSETAKQLVEEEAKLRLVFDALKATKNGTKERGEALNEVNKNYGLTLKNLSNENEFVRQLDEAYTFLIKNMERKIRLQLVEEEVTKLLTERIKLESSIKNADNVDTKKRIELEKELASLRKGITTEDIFTDPEILKQEQRQREFRIQQIEDELRFMDELGQTGESALSIIDKKIKDLYDSVGSEGVFDFVLNGSDGKGTGKAKKAVEDFGITLDNLKEDKIMSFLKFMEDNNFNIGGIVTFDEDGNVTADELFSDMEIEAEKFFMSWQDQLKKMIESTRDIFKEITDMIAELIRINESKLDQQIARQQMIFDGAKDREAELRRIAEERGLDASESIDAEREAQKKALVEIERLEGKKRELEMTIAAMKLLADGKSVADIKNAITDIKSFVKANAEGSFYEGTETTVGAALGHNNIKDGHFVNVDDKEAIFNPSQTAALDIRPGGNTTQDIVDSFQHVQRMADSKFSGASSVNSFAENIYSSAILNQLIEMKQELKTLPDNMPQSDLGFNAFTGALEYERRTKLRREKVRYNIRRK